MNFDGMEEPHNVDPVNGVLPGRKTSMPSFFLG